MLVNKKYATGSVVSMKLVNGDEFVAKLIDETTTEYKVEQPMTVIPAQTGIRLIPSMFTVEPGQVFEIDKSHIMMHNAAADQVADHYRELTTGIKTVRNESKIIL